MDPEMKNELIALAKALIEIPSSTGNEKEIAFFIKDTLDKLNFEAAVSDYNSVAGILDLGEGPVVCMDAHIDTVPADTEKWSLPPYGGVVKNGRLYGRGASDMKGALASMIIAARMFSLSPSKGGKIIISGSSWEEYFEGHTFGKTIEGLEKKGLSPDYVIIGEASLLNVKRGQRGRTRVLCRIKGKPSHSAHPKAGINAVYKASEFIEKIKTINLESDPFLGEKIIELIGIHSLPYPVDSVVPDFCEISYDLRLLKGDTENQILELFHQAAEEQKKEDPEFNYEITLASDEITKTNGEKELVKAFPKAWEFPADHEIVQKTLNALQSIGQRPKVTRYDFCTNGSFSAGEKGIPTIGYGPGDEKTAHTVNEYIEIEQLEKACEGYYAILKNLLAQ